MLNPTPSIPDDDIDVSGLLAGREAFERVARSMFAMLKTELSKIELDFSEIGSVSQASLRGWRPDGTETSFKDFPDVEDGIEQLRAIMYRENTGTWYSVRLAVTSAGTVDADYDYDNPPWSHFDYAPAAYAEDLKKYPRDEAHIPAWFRDLLEAAARP